MVNARRLSRPLSGTLGPEVLVTNGVTLIDETDRDFQKVKDGAMFAEANEAAHENEIQDSLCLVAV